MTLHPATFEAATGFSFGSDEGAPIAAAIEDYLKSMAEFDRVGINPPQCVASVRVRPQKHDSTWFSVTVRSMPRPAGVGYTRDQVDAYHVTFTGGCPSNAPGQEMSFRRMSPGLAGSTDKTVKDAIKAVIPAGAWSYDATPGAKNPDYPEGYRWPDARLERFELVDEAPFETTWRVVIRKPHTD